MKTKGTRYEKVVQTEGLIQAGTRHLEKGDATKALRSFAQAISTQVDELRGLLPRSTPSLVRNQGNTSSMSTPAALAEVALKEADKVLDRSVGPFSKAPIQGSYDSQYPITRELALETFSYEECLEKLFETRHRWLACLRRYDMYTQQAHLSALSPRESGEAQGAGASDPDNRDFIYSPPLTSPKTRIEQNCSTLGLMVDSGPSYSHKIPLSEPYQLCPRCGGCRTSWDHTSPANRSDYLLNKITSAGPQSPSLHEASPSSLLSGRMARASEVVLSGGSEIFSRALYGREGLILDHFSEEMSDTRKNMCNQDLHFPGKQEGDGERKQAQRIDPSHIPGDARAQPPGLVYFGCCNICKGLIFAEQQRKMVQRKEATDIKMESRNTHEYLTEAQSSGTKGKRRHIRRDRVETRHERFNKTVCRCDEEEERGIIEGNVRLTGGVKNPYYSCSGSVNIAREDITEQGKESGRGTCNNTPNILRQVWTHPLAPHCQGCKPPTTEKISGDRNNDMIHQTRLSSDNTNGTDILKRRMNCGKYFTVEKKAPLEDSTMEDQSLLHHQSCDDRMWSTQREFHDNMRSSPEDCCDDNSSTPGEEQWQRQGGEPWQLPSLKRLSRPSSGTTDTTAKSREVLIGDVTETLSSRKSGDWRSSKSMQGHSKGRKKCWDRDSIRVARRKRAGKVYWGDEWQRGEGGQDNMTNMTGVDKHSSGKHITSREQGVGVEDERRSDWQGAVGDGHGQNEYIGKDSTRLLEEIKKKDEQIRILRTQLNALGEQPIEDIVTLEEAKLKLRKAIDTLMGGDDSREAENNLARWDKYVTNHPDHIEEEAAKERQWDHDNKSKNIAALHTMRSFIPPDIFHAGLEVLKSNGLSPLLAKRVFERKVLWLLRAPESMVSKIHLVELKSKYIANDLDLMELRAVYTCLPVKFENDADGAKGLWRAGFRKRLEELVKKDIAGQLKGSEARHPAYEDCEEGPFDPDAAVEAQETIRSSAFDAMEKPVVSPMSMEKISLISDGLTPKCKKESHRKSSLNALDCQANSGARSAPTSPLSRPRRLTTFSPPFQDGAPPDRKSLMLELGQQLHARKSLQEIPEDITDQTAIDIEMQTDSRGFRLGKHPDKALNGLQQSEPPQYSSPSSPSSPHGEVALGNDQLGSHAPLGGTLGTQADPEHSERSDLGQVPTNVYPQILGKTEQHEAHATTSNGALGMQDDSKSESTGPDPQQHLLLDSSHTSDKSQHWKKSNPDGPQDKHNSHEKNNNLVTRLEKQSQSTCMRDIFKELAAKALAKAKVAKND